MKRKIILFFLMLFTLIPSYLSFCNDALFSEKKNVGVRTLKNWGFDLAAGEPYPSSFGLLVSYNYKNLMRVSLGGGTMVYWTSYAVSTKFFFLESNATPYIGGSLFYISGYKGTHIFWDIAADHWFSPALNAGFDYTHDTGAHACFNVGFSVIATQIVLMPGISVGWYF